MLKPAVSATTIAAVFALAGCERRVTVQSPPAAAAPARGITVMGHGEAESAPDLARLVLGVEARAAAAEIATREANQRMDRVVLALKQQGVAPKDVQTRELSLVYEPPGRFEPPPPTPLPRAETPPPPAAPPATGDYRMTNLVEVTVRELDRLGRVMATAMGAGANRVHGVTFDLADRSRLERQARQAAMQNARARAEELARLAGVELGPVVSISEHGGGLRRVALPMARMEAAVEVPVERGQLQVSQDVQVVFALPERE